MLGQLKRLKHLGALMAGFWMTYSATPLGVMPSVKESLASKQTNKQTNKQTFTHIYIYAICVYYCKFKKYIDILIEPATNTPSLAMLCFCSTFFHIYKAMDLTPHVGSFPSPPPLHQGQVSPFIHTPWFGSARFKKPKHPWYVAFFFTCNHSIQLSAISFLDYCKHEIELMWGPYKHVRKLEKQLLFVYAYICI